MTDERLDSHTAFRYRLSKWIFPILLLFGSGILAIISLLFFFKDQPTSISMGDAELVVVDAGIVDEIIPIRGRIAPASSVFLDVSTTGRVVEVFADEGEQVDRGDPIVRLQNTDLQLATVSNEARIAEQINNLENTRRSMAEEEYLLEQQLIELRYDLQRAVRRNRNLSELRLNQAVSLDEYKESVEELEFLRAKEAVIEERVRSLDEYRDRRLQHVEESVERLERQRDIAQEVLQSLVVNAPIDGVLTSIEKEVGRVVQQGDRLGRIDSRGDHRIEAQVDEYYLGVIELGQAGVVESGSNRWHVQVSRIYPEVKNGQFAMELEFTDFYPSDIRVGQSVHIRLKVPSVHAAMRLPRTEGISLQNRRHVYIVQNESRFADRRTIRIGRAGEKYIEVLDGVSPGDEVLIPKDGSISSDTIIIR